MAVAFDRKGLVMRVVVAIGETRWKYPFDFGVIFRRQGECGDLGKLAQVRGGSGAGDRDQVVAVRQHPGKCSGGC